MLSRARILRLYSTYYTKTHQWVYFNYEEREVQVGITNYLQSKLGRVQNIDLPELNSAYSQGDVIGVIKAQNQTVNFLSPVTGETIQLNTTLNTQPELLNSSPEEKGWVCRFAIDNPTEVEKMMDKEAYEKYIQE